MLYVTTKLLTVTLWAREVTGSWYGQDFVKLMTIAVVSLPQACVN